jgi:hypothetical protein
MPISSNSYVEIDSVVSGSSPDGSSAKSAAEAAKSAAEAAKSAAEAAASAYVTNLTYDVEIPFNEGMEMQRGYGNLDANGNRAVDFTRASTTGNINKSGISETLAIDEAQISIDGYGSFVSFTNSLLDSENLDQSTWDKVGGVVLSQDGTLDSEGQNQAWHVDSDSDGQYIHQNVSLTLSGESVLMYQEVKAGTSNTALIRWVSDTGGTPQDIPATLNLTTGEITSSSHDYIEVQEIDNGWWGVWFANASNNTGNTLAKSNIGTSSGSIYVSRCMIVDRITGVKLPYLATTNIAVTRAADKASIPTLNNLPKNGDDFTIIIDCSVSDKYATDQSVLFRSGLSVNAGGINVARSALSRTISFDMSNNGGSVSVSTQDVDGDLHRFTFRYKDGIITAFVDGVAGTSSSAFISFFNFSDDLFIGVHPNSVFNINSYIKNFKILHTGLTDDQIAALGSAK